MANSFLLLTFCDKKAVINLIGAPDSKFQEYVCSKLLLNDVNVSQGSMFSSPLHDSGFFWTSPPPFLNFLLSFVLHAHQLWIALEATGLEMCQGENQCFPAYGWGLTK